MELILNMNTTFQQGQKETPSKGLTPLIKSDLYEDHAEGIHHIIRKDLIPYSIKLHNNQFLSTGNFDMAAIKEGKAMVNSKTYSCGNFITSTQKENWNRQEGEVKPSKFSKTEVEKELHKELHIPSNLKYNIGREEPTSKYRSAGKLKGHARHRSGEEAGNLVESPAAPLEKNISLVKQPKKESALSKAAKESSSRVSPPKSPANGRSPKRTAQLSGFNNQKEEFQHAASPAKHSEDSDEESINEFDLESDEDAAQRKSPSNQQHPQQVPSAQGSKPVQREPQMMMEMDDDDDFNQDLFFPPQANEASQFIPPMYPNPVQLSPPHLAAHPQENIPGAHSHQHHQMKSSQAANESLLKLFESIRDQCLAQLLNKKSGKKVDQSSILEDEFPQAACTEQYTPAQLLEMSFSSKPSSMEVQAFLRSQNPQSLNFAANYLCKHLENLIFNKFGNYVVQFLVTIHEPSKKLASNLTLSNFVAYAENEYGSRIMQKLCTISPEYCLSALRSFYKNFDQLIKNITGSILLSKLISASKNEEDYLFAIQILEHNKEYLRKAYFNRMLSTLVSCCSEKTLQYIVTLIKNHIWILMNDKFGNYVLQIMVERHQQLGTSLVKMTCLKYFSVILSRKYPKFLLIKMIEMEPDKEFCTQLMEKIAELDDNALYAVLSKRESAMLLLLILAKTKEQNIPLLVDRILDLVYKIHHNEFSHCKRWSDL